MHPCPHPAAADAGAPEPPQWAAGDKVEVEYDGVWLAAKVLRVRKSGGYVVEWAEDESTSKIEPDMIRACGSKASPKASPKEGGKKSLKGSPKKVSEPSPKKGGGEKSGKMVKKKAGVKKAAKAGRGRPRKQPAAETSTDTPPEDVEPSAADETSPKAKKGKKEALAAVQGPVVHYLGGVAMVFFGAMIP
jgi:hypothetical protein